MNIENAGIPGSFLIKPKIWGDSRGFFLETFRERWLADAGVSVSFVQDNLSRSKKGTLRGLHYQLNKPQAKLVTVLKGAVLDVFVDIRRNSPTFGQWSAIELNDENRWQLFIPAGFAHGFTVLSETADFFYKCSEYYDAPSERGIRWDDPALGIGWNVENPILSEKDRHQPLLAHVAPEFLPEYS